MISKIARYKVKPERVEEAKKYVSEFVERVKNNEMGTLVYEAYLLSDGVSFEHMMTFTDEEAEQIHTSSEYAKQFTAGLYPLCESEPGFETVKRMGVV